MTEAALNRPFIRLDEAAPQQLSNYITESLADLAPHVVPTLVSLLKLGVGPTNGAGLNRYEHSLQTATRAYRENARLDMIVAALLHDVGDAFAATNHAEVAAALLRKFVDEETAWVVAHHTLFQGYHFWDKMGLDSNAREQYAGHPYFDATAHFCAEWDQVAFDPKYDSYPIEFFIPAMDELFARPVQAL